MATLGRFGHHPDPATDYCCEVDRLEGEAYEAGVGMRDPMDVRAAAEKAMGFRVGGDPLAVRAKGVLRDLCASLDARIAARFG